MSPVARRRFGAYPSFDRLLDLWALLASEVGAKMSEHGRSVEGRPLVTWSLGTQDAPRVFLTGLIHGVELIGGLALLEAMRAIAADAALSRSLRFEVLPIVNPDGVHRSIETAMRGSWSIQRCNAHGVDLNRNFPRFEKKIPWHPFAGSRRRWSMHYTGPHPLSEPETRFVYERAMEARPRFALGFHSFGNMLLYPFAHTRKPNPRLSLYQRLGTAFLGAQSERSRSRYRLGPAYALYPTVGDLDDWLDIELQSLAFTVEVSRPSLRILRGWRFLFPFAWMNPSEIRDALAGVIPGVLGFAQAARHFAARTS